MGILTSVHQVPLDTLKKLQRNPALLDFFIYSDKVDATELGMPAGWEAPQCGFDKAWEDLATILRQCGHYRAGSMLEYGATQMAYGSSDVFCRCWRKTKLKRIQADLKELTAAQLKDKALGVEDLTDWSGDPAHDRLDYYLQSFDALHTMIRNAIDAGDVLIAISS